MLDSDLPTPGSRVKIWPHPERLVTDGPAPFTTTGSVTFRSFLPKDGKEVIWTKYHLEQLRSGDILLHDPEPEAKPESPPEPKLVQSAPPMIGAAQGAIVRRKPSTDDKE